MPVPPTRPLFDKLLQCEFGISLTDFTAQRPGRTWRSLADELTKMIDDDQISVSGDTLRRWAS